MVDLLLHRLLLRGHRVLDELPHLWGRTLTQVQALVHYLLPDAEDLGKDDDQEFDDEDQENDAEDDAYDDPEFFVAEACYHDITLWCFAPKAWVSRVPADIVFKSSVHMKRKGRRKGQGGEQHPGQSH